MADIGANAQRVNDMNCLRQNLEAMVERLPSNLITRDDCRNEEEKANLFSFLAELCYGREITPEESAKFAQEFGDILGKAYCAKVCRYYDTSSCRPLGRN